MVWVYMVWEIAEHILAPAARLVILTWWLTTQSGQQRMLELEMKKFVR